MNILLLNRLFSAHIFSPKHQSMPYCSPVNLSFRSSGLPAISSTPIRTSSEHRLSPTMTKNQTRHSKLIIQINFSFSYCIPSWLYLSALQGTISSIPLVLSSY